MKKIKLELPRLGVRGIMIPHTECYHFIFAPNPWKCLFTTYIRVYDITLTMIDTQSEHQHMVWCWRVDDCMSTLLSRLNSRIRIRMQPLPGWVKSPVISCWSTGAICMWICVTGVSSAPIILLISSFGALFHQCIIFMYSIGGVRIGAKSQETVPHGYLQSISVSYMPQSMPFEP
jgi:hypothetical protein